MTDPATPAQPVKKSGLAITALVLGIVSIPFAVIPLINVLAFLLGGLAVIFGIIGIVVANGVKRTGRGLAVAGLVTGLVGIIIGIIANAVFFAAVESVDDALNVEIVESTSSAAGTSTDPFPFGTDVSLETGVDVSVAQPRSVTPSSEFLVDEGDVYFWAVDVTVTNNGQDDEALLTTNNGYLASGEACDSLFDSEQFGDQLFSLDGSLPAGKTKTSTLAFACPAEGPVELEFSAGFLSQDLFFSEAAS